MNFTENFKNKINSIKNYKISNLYNSLSISVEKDDQNN